MSQQQQNQQQSQQNQLQQQQLPVVPASSGQNAQEPSAEGQRLMALFDEMEYKQLDFLDEAGKQMIQGAATFLTILFAVTAFSNNFPPPYLKGNLTAKVLVIVTLSFYLATIGASIWGIRPRLYRRYLYNVTRLGKEWEKITRHKVRSLRVAGVLFAMGTIVLAALIVSIILPL